MINGMKKKGRQAAISFGWPFPGSLIHSWLSETNTLKSSAQSFGGCVTTNHSSQLDTFTWFICLYFSNIGMILRCILAFLWTYLIFFLTYIYIKIRITRADKIPLCYYLAFHEAWRRNQGSNSVKASVESKWQRRHRRQLLLCRFGGRFFYFRTCRKSVTICDGENRL